MEKRNGAVVALEGVSKRYGPLTALDGVSFTLEGPGVYGLLGPNGAGKTTAIRIVNRITIPTSGEVLFDGRRITDADVARIGYLPEERGLYRKMEVGDQALYLAQLKGMTVRDATRELKEWFVRFGIQDWWKKKVEELSKGMAQKVQFITTVVHKPSLMILDEPFSGFDPVNAELIRTEILRLRDEGATIILSTHNMESVEELCDEITLINRSRVVISGGVDEIRHRYGEDNVEIVYTEGVERRQEVGKRAEVNSRLSALIAQGVTLNSMKEVIPRMNDIFIKLVTEGA